MGITIDNILESISNPQGKFRTLDRIYPVSDPNGMPYHTFREPYVKFLAIWDGKSHTLMVSFRSTVVEQMRNTCELTSRTPSPYLVPCSYMESELTVFDDDGEPHEIDVILTENPHGRSLLDYAKEKSFAGDTNAVKEAFNAFCGMGRWLLGAGIIHGRIRNANLRIDDNNKIKLLDYRYLTVDNSGKDNQNIAAIALYLKALIDDPQLIFNISHLPASQVAEQLPEMAAMKNLKDRQELIAALDSLRSTTVTFEDKNTLTEKNYTRRYDRIEPAREGIHRVERNGLFGFADKNEQEIAPPVYGFATEFESGRSVVVLDDYFGLLGADGKYILEPAYESIDWYPEEGIVQVSSEGKFGLTDRNGKITVPFTYDWMGVVSEDMICVRLDDFYGYIDINGHPVIKPIYTDAESFRGGKAYVTLGGASFHINKNGDKL